MSNPDAALAAADPETETELLHDVLAAALACTSDPDPAVRAGGLKLVGQVCEALVDGASDADLDAVWAAAELVEALACHDPTPDVRAVAERSLRLIDAACRQVPDPGDLRQAALDSLD